LDKGAIWDRQSGHPENVLSWHEIELEKFGLARIWIHSRAISDDSAGKPQPFRGGPKEELWYFTFIGIEVQIHGAKVQPISEDEKRLRLELAALAPVGSNPSLNTALIREIPAARLESDHHKIILSCIDSGEFAQTAKLQLVKSERTRGKIFKNGALGNSIYESALELRTTNLDAIAIAKLYSDLHRLGSKKIVQEIVQQTGASAETIYVAIRVARTKKWLTSSGAGKSGGDLTPLGIKEFKSRGGQERLAEFRPNGKGKK
jgi:hypothetical protein